MASNSNTQKTLSHDLIVALQNQAVSDALAKSISPYIELAIEEKVNKHLIEINKTFQMLINDFNMLKSKTEGLTEENENLKKRLAVAENKIENFERNQKSNNLIISGLPEASYAERASNSADVDNASTADSHEVVESTVVNFINTNLNININKDQIASAFRLKKGKKDKVRPTLVCFSSRKIRDEIFANKKVLGDKQIYISEHLTKSASNIFYNARQMKHDKKINSAWTRNGQVYIKLTETSDRKCINNLEELQSVWFHSVY